MGPKFDRVAASLATTLDRTSEASLRRGMHYPTRWDPFFKEYMTLADAFHYPPSTLTSTSDNSSWTQRSPTDRERSALSPT